MGGPAGRLDPRPRREDAAQEEGHDEEEEAVRPRETVWGEGEEEVAAAVGSGTN